MENLTATGHSAVIDAAAELFEAGGNPFDAVGGVPGDRCRAGHSRVLTDSGSTEPSSARGGGT